MYDLKMYKVILKKMKLGTKYMMLKYKENWPVPQIKFHKQVQVKSRLCGICASDLHQINVNLPYSATILARKENPFPNGHEVVGEISQVGEDVDEFQVGDRVVHSPIAACKAYGFNECVSCRNGNYSTCYALVGRGDGSELEEQYGGRLGFGGFSGGGFSEFFVGFSKQFTKIPDLIPDEIAVLSEPLAVAIHGVLMSFPDDNDAVVVIGAGIIGLMTVVALRLLGSKSRIIALARYQFQADAIKRIGADEVIVEHSKDALYQSVASSTEGELFKPRLGSQILYGNKGPDIIIDTVGTDSTLDDSLHLVRSNGKIVIVGMGFGTTKKTDWALQVYKEIEIYGSMMHGMEKVGDRRIDTMELALELMEKNLALFDGLVTHEYAIDDYKSAFDCSSRKKKNGIIKVVFRY